jgi:hypothetical protein
MIPLLNLANVSETALADFTLTKRVFLPPTTDTRRKTLARVMVLMQGDGNLSKVITASMSRRGIAYLLDSRQC